MSNKYGFNYFSHIQPLLSHPLSKKEAWTKLDIFIPEKFSNIYLLTSQDFSFITHLLKNRKLNFKSCFRIQCTDIYSPLMEHYKVIRNNYHELVERIELLQKDPLSKKDHIPHDLIDRTAWFLFYSHNSISNLITHQIYNKNKPDLYLRDKISFLNENRLAEFSEFLNQIWIEPDIEKTLKDISYANANDLIVFDFSLYDHYYHENYTASNTLKYYCLTSKILTNKIFRALSKASQNRSKILILGNKFTPADFIYELKGIRKSSLIIEGNKFIGRDCPLISGDIQECNIWTNFRTRKMEINSNGSVIPK